MAETKIEWTATRLPDGTMLPGYTFNPWIGCAKVSAGCKNCYAETLMDERYKKAKWGVNGTRNVTSDTYWKQPLAWNRQAAASGIRRKVFCASLADVFENRDDLVAPRARLFDLIRQTPHLDWLLLTKRPEHVRFAIGEVEDLAVASWAADDLARWCADWLAGSPPPNVWMGTSVEDQKAADERIPHLLDVPAVVRFLSCEPLLGPVDLPGLFYYGTEASGGVVPLREKGHPQLDWVIVGGESGHDARPMYPEWAAWGTVHRGRPRAAKKFKNRGRRGPPPPNAADN